jgi:hypothetical protein
MASPNLSEIITTTLRNRTGKLADNVTKNNALLSRLKARGKAKPASGGRTLVQELEYAQNVTGGWYSGYEPLNVSQSDVLTGAEFDWKQYAGAVTISGLEQLQNAGKEKIIDLLDARIGNMEKTMMNDIAIGCYADGTGTGGKEMGGLQLLVAKTVTSGTVGGINQGTYTFWRNITRSAVGNSVTLSATTIQSEWNTMYAQLVRGADKPDLIMVDNNEWLFYLGSLQTIQRITNPDLGQLGFTNLKFMEADVVLDGGVGGAAPTTTAYFLNTDYIFYRPHSDRNMVPIGGDRMNTNQDAIVKLIGWAGNMTVSNRSLQGVHYL